MGRQVQLLLDTHTLLWWWASNRNLSDTAAALIRDPDTIVLVSSVSPLEIAIKHRKGKLPDGERFFRHYHALMEEHEFISLPVTDAHSLLAGSYPADHRDPFDRLLAAQSELENATLLTRDPAFADFPCETRW